MLSVRTQPKGTYNYNSNLCPLARPLVHLRRDLYHTIPYHVAVVQPYHGFCYMQGSRARLPRQTRPPSSTRPWPTLHPSSARRVQFLLPWSPSFSRVYATRACTTWPMTVTYSVVEVTTVVLQYCTTCSLAVVAGWWESN